MTDDVHNPFQAPAPDAGPGPATGRMPSALRRDLLKIEAAIKVIGLLHFPFAGCYLYAICWSMYHKHPLAPWQLLASTPISLAIVYSGVMLLAGAGAYFLQLWARVLLLATSVLPLMTWLIVPPDFLWNALSFEVSHAVHLAWQLTPVLSLATIGVLGSANSETVTSGSYRLIIRQTPQVGPPPVFRYLTLSILLLVLAAYVVERRG